MITKRWLFYFGIVFLFISLPHNNVYGTDVYLAAIVYIDDTADGRSLNVTDGIWDAIGKQDIAPPFHIHRAVRNQTPKTLIEALSLSQMYDYPFLIYGYVHKSPENYLAELKLLDLEKGEVVKTFYTSDTHDQYERMIQDIGTKIGYYFREELGFKYIGYDEFAVNLWRLDGTLGYWMPVSNGWDSSLLGIVAVQFGAGYIPISPYTVFRGKPLDIALNMGVEYTFGISRPSRETALLHSLIVRAGPSLEFRMTNRQRFGFGGGFSYRLDILSKQRKYDSAVGMITGTPGFFISILHDIKYNEVLDLGWILLLDTSWYSPVLWTVSPRLRIVYHLSNKE